MVLLCPRAARACSIPCTMPAAARAMEIMLSLQPPHFSSPLPWRRRSHLHGLATPRRVSTVAPAATLETAAPPASLSFPILVNGCTGKMGVAVAEAAASRGLHLVPVSFSSRENLDKTVQIGDTDIQIYGPSARDDVLSSVIDEFTDVVIMDYTAPYSLMLSCIASLVCHFVMGTTGGDRQLLYKSVQDSNNYALISPQMGKQVVAFLAAMEIMAEQFPGAFSGYRLEVQESHQAGKLDISGTAKAVIACFEKLGVSYDMDQLMLSCIASLVCHFVMGTTGGDRQLLYKSVQDSNNYALISPQMGKQVVAFLAAMEIMAEQFPGAFSGYRLEVQESHQAGKLDISGTAKAVIACFEKLGVSYDMDQLMLSCIASLVCHFVMGTTGGDQQLLYKSVQDSNNYALISPQMGKQVVAFLAAMEIMAEQFPGAFSGYRLEVQESHQAGKLDISGTAKAVIACFEKLGVSYDMDQVVQIRDPEQQLEMVGVPEEHLAGHAFHLYHLTSPDDCVSFEFQHNVCGRSIYAEGSVDAAISVQEGTIKGFQEDL